MGEQILLSSEAIRRTYTWLAFPLSVLTRYEARATSRLLAHGQFNIADSVFEFGCGTGHVAETLMHEFLPSHARYTGLDVTPKMCEMTRQRLARFGSRVRVHVSNGGAPAAESATYDRFLSTFVLDILPEQEIRATLNAAHEMLNEDGLLCLASLAPGARGLSRPIMRGWSAIHHAHPALVGGCRPLHLASFLSEAQWQIRYRETVWAAAVPLEIIVAEKCR